MYFARRISKVVVESSYSGVSNSNVGLETNVFMDILSSLRHMSE
jgi:hypothetical protein